MLSSRLHVSVAEEPFHWLVCMYISADEAVNDAVICTRGLQDVLRNLQSAMAVVHPM